MGQAIRPTLEAASKKTVSVDKQSRLADLLNRLKKTAVSHELRVIRLIDVLEHIPTAAAGELLGLLADGRYGESYVKDAKEAVKRRGPRP